MAKTIRSHPTSHILVLEPIFGLFLYFHKTTPKWTYIFFIFHLPTSEKTTPPKGKKMRMDHPFILGFCQNVTFYIVVTIIFQFVRKKTLF